MKMIQKFSLVLLSFFFVTTSLVPAISAAEIISEDSITVIEEDETLNNPYLFGERIEIAVPVENDLISIGRNISVDGLVEGSIWATGGDMLIQSEVGNSVRVAGGNIIIEGSIAEDLIATGRTVTVSENASISGDLIFAGRQLRIDSPVTGNIMVYGGDVTINAPVGGNVTGEVERLTFGNNATIAGDLNYTAKERAQIAENQVQGEITYHEQQVQNQAQEGIVGLITAGTIYKFLIDVLFTLLFLWLLRPFLVRVINRIDANYLNNAGIGFAMLVLMPLIGVLTLIIFWLSISIFLLYGLFIILSMAVMKLLIGWKTLTWWEGRNNRNYELDWRAAIIGVLIVFLVGLIPVLGWMGVFILFLLSLGGLSSELSSLVSSQRPTKKTTKNSRSK